VTTAKDKTSTFNISTSLTVHGTFFALAQEDLLGMYYKFEGHYQWRTVNAMQC